MIGGIARNEGSYVDNDVLNTWESSKRVQRVDGLT